MNRDELIAELKKFPNLEIKFKYADLWYSPKISRLTIVRTGQIEDDEELHCEEDKDKNSIILE